MKKLILLILASVAVYGNNIKECLGGDVKACEKVADVTFRNVRDVNYWRDGEYYIGRTMEYINCNDFMKAMRKGCNLGSGLCCALLGDEFHPIIVKSIYSEWQPKYGVNCSLRNQDEAFKYYKKACELGESAGCQRYTELQHYIAEIDKIHKKAI